MFFLGPYLWWFVLACLFAGVVLVAGSLIVEVFMMIVGGIHPVYRAFADRWLPGRRITTGDVDLFAHALTVRGDLSTLQVERIRLAARRLQNRRALLQTMLRAADRANLRLDANRAHVRPERTRAPGPPLFWRG